MSISASCRPVSRPFDSRTGIDMCDELPKGYRFWMACRPEIGWTAVPEADCSPELLESVQAAVDDMLSDMLEKAGEFFLKDQFLGPGWTPAIECFFKE